MQLYTGTSGFSYDEWRGPFYPEDLPSEEMLSYYATKLPTVEINNTFYRMPKPNLVEGWAAKVPESFRFVLKASQRITHHKRLKEARADAEYMLGVFSAMHAKLGAILFQLPPNFRQDLARLADFCEGLPAGTRAAFEFRHPSWFADETYAKLAERGFALVASETAEDPQPPLVRTADWGYLRLRREAYTPEDLESWLARVRGQDWREVFVFFKHEDAGTGPRLASEFLERFSAANA